MGRQSTPSRRGAPLAGLRIGVTRAWTVEDPLARLLAAAGAEPVPLPVIDIRFLWRHPALDRTLRSLARYDDVIFTSANGVRGFLEHLRRRGRCGDALAGKRITVMGPGTEHALAAAGLTPHIVPRRFQQEGVLAALKGRPVRGRRILLPRAKVARDLLPETLRQRGAIVDVIPVYQNVVPYRNQKRIRRALRRGLDAITCTSASTVTNLAKILGAIDLSRPLRGATIACIGPITAEAARDHGLTPHCVARVSTFRGLTTTIRNHFPTQ